VALLVLLLVWGALIVTWLRSRAHDGGFSDPVGTFNRHLRVLEKTAPTRYPAANQRRPPTMGTIAPYRPGSAGGLGPMAGNRGLRPSTPGALRRAQTQKRRRDVFFALLAGVVVSLLLAMVPGLHAMFYLQVLFDLLMGGYIALLVRIRNLATERELKLSYLRPNARPVAASQGRLARDIRSGGGYPVDGYDYDYGYGELAVRRAAN